MTLKGSTGPYRVFWRSTGLKKGSKGLKRFFLYASTTEEGFYKDLFKVFHSASGFNMRNLFFVIFWVCGSGVVVEGEGVVEGSPASLHSQHHRYDQ